MRHAPRQRHMSTRFRQSGGRPAGVEGGPYTAKIVRGRSSAPVGRTRGKSGLPQTLQVTVSEWMWVGAGSVPSWIGWFGPSGGGESRALVVVGEPGIGKTALLDHLVDQASGCRVIRGSG